MEDSLEQEVLLMGKTQSSLKNSLRSKISIFEKLKLQFCTIGNHSLMIKTRLLEFEIKND